MTSTRSVPWVGWLLATIGVVIILGEVVRNWLWNHPIEGWVIAIGAGCGFFGFYRVDSKRAKDAFGFAVDSGVKIIGIMRSGRRSTDVVIPVTAVAPAPPSAVPDRPTTPEEAP
jgi:hypothetical protein